MGNLLHEKEVRQIGGLILILSVAVMVYPIFDTTSRLYIDFDEHPNKLYTGDDAVLNYILLVGDLCIVALGLVGMAIGFMAMTDVVLLPLTTFALVWEQTAFIDWIGKMYNLSATGYLTGYKVSGEAAFYFSMGILKIFFLCFLLYGSLGLGLFILYAFQTGKGHTKNAGYYRSCLILYSFMYAGHGLFPFLIQGIKIYIDVSNNSDIGTPLEKALTFVVGQPIKFPEISMAVGVILTVIGIWGIGRGTATIPNEDRYFQIAVGFGFLLFICAIVLCEFSFHQPGAAMSSMAAVSFVNPTIILAWLDEKARTVPEEMDEGYYDDDAFVTKGRGLGRGLKSIVAHSDDSYSSRSSGSSSRSSGSESRSYSGSSRTSRSYSDSEGSESIEAEGMA